MAGVKGNGVELGFVSATLFQPSALDDIDKWDGAFVFLTNEHTLPGEEPSHKPLVQEIWQILICQFPMRILKSVRFESSKYFQLVSEIRVVVPMPCEGTGYQNSDT